MDPRERIILLAERYGGTLTKKQLDYLMIYYCDDLSYYEIAANVGISAAGVRDIISRAEKKLEFLERKIGFAAFWEQLNRMAALPPKDVKTQLIRLLEKSD